MPVENSKITLLRNSSMFSELPDEAMAELAGLASTVLLSANQQLFMEGAPSDGCYAVLSGSLRVSLFSNDGGETVLAILGPGEIVGEMSLFGSVPRSATVTAMDRTEVCFLPRASFLRFADQNPALYRHFLQLMCARLRATNDALASYATLPLSGRLARVFIRLSESFGHQLDGGRILIRQRFTQTDLSSMAGSARENVSRQITDWRRQDILSRISHYYCLNDPGAFRRIAGL